MAGLRAGRLLGWDANQQQLVGWYVEMVYPFVVEGKVTSEHNNQSLPGLVSRLATHSPSFTTYVKDEKTGQDVQTPTEYDNFLERHPTSALAGERLHGPVRPGGDLALPDADAAARRMAAERGVRLILIGMLLFSERTWKHHCVTLVLPFAVLCYHLATQPGRPAVAVGADRRAGGRRDCSCSPPAPACCDDAAKAGDVTDLFGKQMEVYGAYFWVFVLLGISLMVLVPGPTRRPLRPSSRGSRAGLSPPDRERRHGRAGE